MNPLEYLFKSFSALHLETQLLEACDWDEERAGEVKESLEKAFSEVLGEMGKLSEDGLMLSLREKLIKTNSEKEVETCLHIVDGILKGPIKNYGDGYEN